MSILTRDERLACGPSVLPRPSSPLLSQLAVPPQLQIVVGQLTVDPLCSQAFQCYTVKAPNAWHRNKKDRKHLQSTQSTVDRYTDQAQSTIEKAARETYNTN